ncbi:Telomere end binding protein [Lasiodiplodia theobromae]|uniref:Telomere end binding protein n=1 Tax=Lasiodiplodia theobromae TaxID=45133 RepID=A0A8H7MAF8_9PEZI|nr:Telomere end binding protein [Lasiodiplodia theobromae]
MPLGAPVRQPDSFLTIEQALEQPTQKTVNVIGVVSEILPMKDSNGSGRRSFALVDAPANHLMDMQFAIQLQDKSVATKLHEGRSIRVKWFIKHYMPQAPQIENVGDTVILRGFKVIIFSNKHLLLSSYQSECIIFPPNVMPDPHFNDSYASGQMLNYLRYPQTAKAPTSEQQLWAISLRHALCSNLATEPTAVVSATPRQSSTKFRLIKDIGPSQFFDLVVEVVKSYPPTFEMYVTDYTENTLLYRYKYPHEDRGTSVGRDGDPYGFTDELHKREWAGPFGQMTLQVKFWDNHVDSLHKVKEGDFIQLQNVHIKMDDHGKKIEGALHGDRHHPGRVHVTMVKTWDPRVRALKERKQAYLTAMKNREQQGQSKQSRKEKNKKKKAMEQKGKQTAAQSESPANEADHLGPNSHVKCERPQDPIVRLADIENNERRLYKTPNGVSCDLPFINAIYRARVRVVDFWPEKLEDFSRSLDDPEFNDIREEGQTQSSTTYTALSAGTQHWEWHFCLLVEDAKQPPGTKNPVRIPLLVFDKAAECLLRLDAAE